MSLGIKFIRITNDLLFQRHWHIVLVWKRQLLLFDIFPGESCTSMTFTDECMSFPSFLPQDFSPNDTMTDIRLGTKTLDARGITTEDTNVVQHSSLFEEGSIESQLWMRLCYQQTSVGYLPAVR